MEKKNKKLRKKREYYIVSLPKDDLAFIEDLRISKSNFINQACLSFLEIIKKAGNMNLYFRTNNDVKNTGKKVVKKDDPSQIDDENNDF